MMNMTTKKSDEIIDDALMLSPREIEQLSKQIGQDYGKLGHILDMSDKVAIIRDDLLKFPSLVDTQNNLNVTDEKDEKTHSIVQEIKLLPGIITKNDFCEVQGLVRASITALGRALAEGNKILTNGNIAFAGGFPMNSEWEVECDTMFATGHILKSGGIAGRLKDCVIHTLLDVSVEHENAVIGAAAVTGDEEKLIKLSFSKQTLIEMENGIRNWKSARFPILLQHCLKVHQQLFIDGVIKHEQEETEQSDVSSLIRGGFSMIMDGNTLKTDDASHDEMRLSPIEIERLSQKIGGKYPRLGRLAGMLEEVNNIRDDNLRLPNSVEKAAEILIISHYGAIHDGVKLSPTETKAFAKSRGSIFTSWTSCWNVGAWSTEGNGPWKIGQCFIK